MNRKLNDGNFDLKDSKLASNRSNEYTQLLEKLKHSITSAVDIASKIYEQGKKDGLSNETMRKDIELALEGVIKERQLRNVLPLELKRKYTVDPKSAMIAESDRDGLRGKDQNPNLSNIRQVEKLTHPLRIRGKPLPVNGPQEYAGSFYIDGVEVAADLIKILTHQKKNYANVTKFEGIEQSREYRLKSMKRMSESDLNRMHNYLSFLKQVIYDILPMIGRELETKKDEDKIITR